LSLLKELSFDSTEYDVKKTDKHLEHSYFYMNITTIILKTLNLIHGLYSCLSYDV